MNRFMLGSTFLWDIGGSGANHRARNGGCGSGQVAHARSIPQTALAFPICNSLRTAREWHSLSRSRRRANAAHATSGCMTRQSGVVRQFTFSAKAESSPRWSPDGKQLAFLSNREDQQQIYVMRMDGGEARL